MESRESILDLVLIPLSLLLLMAYHVWLWCEVGLRSLRMSVSINAATRRLWTSTSAGLFPQKKRQQD
jgi:hypothetical protein